MLSLLKPADDVGIYAIAYGFIDQAFVLPDCSSRRCSRSLRGLSITIRREPSALTTTFQTLVLGAIAVTILICPPQAHRGVPPPAGVRSVGDPAEILAFALLFMFVAPGFYNVLIVINKQKHLIGGRRTERRPQRRPQSDPDPALQLQRSGKRDIASEAFVLVGPYFIARLAL